MPQAKELPPELEGEHKKTRRRRLAEEASLLILLRRTFRAATVTPKRDVRGVIEQAGTLTTRIGDAVFIARRAARAAVIERTRAELTRIGAHEVAAELTESGRLSEAIDRVRAERAGRYTAERWATTVAKSEELSSGDVLPVYRKARQEANANLARVASTETSDAWQGERAALAAQTGGRGLWKVWDATLDKRTCPVCEHAHGTAVPVGESFPLGEPGRVHTSCRCDEIILPADLIDFGLSP